LLNNIFDTHAHYTADAFDEDRDELLSSLPSKGIKYVMLAASSVETSEQNIDISNRFDYIFSSVGVHPESVDETDNDYLKTLEKLASHEKVVAIGEIGLDYHYDGYDRDLQLKFFEEQLVLAKKLNLPVIVHSRDATEDCMNLLKKHKPNGVMHCFSGSTETAREIIALGMYISFTGVITFKNARKAIEALQVIPMDRLMLETDCPYMAPEPFRGKRSDSSMIANIAKKIAEIKNITAQEVLDITCTNGIKLFDIARI